MSTLTIPIGARAWCHLEGDAPARGGTVVDGPWCDDEGMWWVRVVTHVRSAEVVTADLACESLAQPFDPPNGPASVRLAGAIFGVLSRRRSGRDGGSWRAEDRTWLQYATRLVREGF